MSKRTHLWLVWALAPLLSACPQDLSVRLVEGSSVEDLRFAISNRARTESTGALWRFKVVEFGGIHGPGKETTLWEIALEVSGQERVDTLRYGTTPPGFRTEIAPSPLAEGGRYYASGGSAGVEFRVQPDGSITEFDPAAETDPFLAAGLREEDVREYWDRFRTALSSPDPQLVAEMIHYPLGVTHLDSTWYVTDPDALVAAFDEIFPPALRLRVGGVPPEEFLATSRGVAVAAGALWIGAACDSTGLGVCPARVFELSHERGEPR